MSLQDERRKVVSGGVVFRWDDLERHRREA